VGRTMSTGNPQTPADDLGGLQHGMADRLEEHGMHTWPAPLLRAVIAAVDLVYPAPVAEPERPRLRLVVR
jgi:hypothetical protein